MLSFIINFLGKKDMHMLDLGKMKESAQSKLRT